MAILTHPTERLRKVTRFILPVSDVCVESLVNQYVGVGGQGFRCSRVN